MKLKTSFCNPTLLKKNISRYTVVWAIFAGMLFVNTTLPLLFFKPLFGLGTQMSAKEAYDAADVLFSGVGYAAGMLESMMFSVLCALFCFNYLHKARGAYMLHAFPLTRTGMYFTNLISGALFIMIPQTAVTLLNVLATAWIPGAPVLVLRCYAIWLLMDLFFYGLAVFCMVLTGKTIFGLFLYFVLNFIAPLLELVLRVILEPLLFGLTGFGTDDFLTLKLSPVIYSFVEFFDDMVSYGTVGASAWTYLLSIAGAGIVLILVSWLLYRIRKMENVGEVVAYRAARTVFKYAFTVCVSLCLGLILTAICGLNALENGNGFPLLICLLVSGFIGYFLAEMMLRRTGRVFNKKLFAGFGIFAAVVVGLFCIVQFDAFNVVHRVPSPETVSYVNITSTDFYAYGGGITIRFDTTEDITKVTEVHQTILDNHDSDEYAGSTGYTLTYKLKNGTTVRRYYSEIYGPYASEMEELFDRPEIEAQYYDFERMENSDGAELYNAPYWNDRNYLSAEEMQQVIDCLREDVEAGGIKFYSEIFRDGGGFVLRLSDKSYVCIPESASSAYKCLQTLIPDLTDEEVIYYD